MDGFNPASMGVAALHAAYRAGRLDPVQVWEALRQRLDRLAPDLGCCFARTDAQALEQAQASARRWRLRQPLGPLDGVPVGVKDNIEVAGWPCSAGTAAWRGRRPAIDAPVWSALAAAGAVLAGKLAMDEGALGAVTRNAAFGDCLNPLDRRATPGGSSGGSAAAVAAGLCAAALGTDTLGSIRIPASYCGLFGFKPSLGRVPMAGIVPLSPRLDTVGPLARSGADLQMLALALPGLDRGPSPSPCAGGPARPWTHLRIGLPEAVNAVPLQEPVRRAWLQARQRLQQLGAQVQEVAVPAWEPSLARRSALLLCEEDGLSFWGDALGADLPGLSADFSALLRYPSGLPAARLDKARALVDDVRVRAVQVFQGVDLLLMPTTPHVAFAATDRAPADQADLAALANLIGAPSLAFPWAGDDLPASLQLVAAPGQDGWLLALAPELDAWPEVAAVSRRLPVA